MEDSLPDEFVWTFPLYILAGNFSVNAEGGPVFRNDTYYVAPKADGVSHLGIFTDRDLAQTYIEQLDPSLGMQAIACSPGEMLRIAKLASTTGLAF